jgi:1,4-dihydroxy-2-naphthoate octaprenyltransferase
MLAARAMTASSAPPLPPPGSLGAWILAARPRTLVTSFVPVLVGAAIAGAAGRLSILPVLVALASALCIQIGTNFANDVFDAEKGADREDRLGPARTVSSGLLRPEAMRRAIVAVFGLAVLLGGYLVASAGWPIVAIGLVSILSGLAYTGGPYPLGYHGLGDVFVFVFFGPVAVCGTSLVASGSVPAEAAWASVPVGALATCLLVVNNVRDRETDVLAQKRTLAVRFGRVAAEREDLALLAASYLVPLGLAVSLRSPIVLLPLLTLPLAVRHHRELVTREGRALNETLAGAARLLTVHGVLFALGLALSRTLALDP